MHVMIDLETMGLGPRPAIVQIGAFPFSLRPEGEMAQEGFRITVSLASSLMAGLELNQETVRWWRDQSAEAQESVCGLAVPLQTALMGLRDWWPKGVEGVWSHGAATDVPWLASAFHVCGLETPWTYRQPRDTRTLFDLAEQKGWQRPGFSAGVKHDALDDARQQAGDVRAAWLHVMGLVPPVSDVRLAC